VNEEQRERAQDLLLALRVKQVLTVLTAFTPVGEEDKALYIQAKAKADASLKEAMAAYVEGAP
jgi:hypothetical protein